MPQILFFSFSTLTTTGYGNLVPDANPGQTFAVAEMLIGQLFLITTRLPREGPAEGGRRVRRVRRRGADRRDRVRPHPQGEGLEYGQLALWLLVGGGVFIVSDALVESKFGEGGGSGRSGSS